MAISFPEELDVLTNPSSDNPVSNPSHSEQHADANDAIEALQAKVGVDDSEVTTSIDYRIRALEGASVDTESIQDIVGDMVSENTETDISVTYDDEAGKLNFAIGENVVTSSALEDILTDPITGYVPLSTVGSNDGVAPLDENGFVPNTNLDIDERIQDTSALMFTSATHTNITVDYDDENGKLTLTSTGGTSADISATPPEDPNVGDLWLDSDTAILYIYDGAFWVEISGSGGGGGGGGGSGNFILSTTAPELPTEGDTWFDTANAKLYVYYDSFWIEAISTGATGPQGPAFLDYKGNWNSGISYLENDGVTYLGSLWRLNAVNSPAGTAPSTPNWQLVIEKGDKGDTGEMTVGTVTTVLFGEPPTITNIGTTTDAILDFEIPAGRAATIEVGTVQDVLYGEPPTVINSGDTSDAVFDFEIPAGRAATIEVGTVQDVLYGEPPTVTNSGDTSDAVFDFEIPAGRAATIEIGEVTTVVDGNPATVTNSGDTSDAIFDFQIPAGPRSTITIGEVVDVDFGNPSTVTNVGDSSDAIFDFELQTGRASTLAVGTVETGSYVSEATVENVGTSSDAIFNFSIPQGIPGDFQPGENPPENPLTGQVWYNTVAGRAYVYYDGFWIEFSPGFTGPQGPAGPAGADGADGADGSSITPLEVSSNITLQKDYAYFVDTSEARTLNLPASPSLGDTLTIYDAYGTAATNNITILRNGSKINGQTEDAIIDVSQAVASFVYTGATLGWRFI
jgi:VCBS repeat-containing protein